MQLNLLGTQASLPRAPLILFVAAILCGFAGLPCAHAQRSATPQPSVLPDAPDVAANAPPAQSFDSISRSVSTSPTSYSAPQPEASRTTHFIDPDQPAPDLNPGDKLLLGLKSSFSPFAVAGWFAVSGYEQATNGTPNFGTDRGAFGRRLEDAAIRDASEDVLSDSVMSTVFREDPRYYRLGRSHSFAHRLIYAASRTLITRTDSGNSAPNYALLTGNLAGSVLTNTYYPQVNRSGSQTVETFAGSIAGSAIGNILDEFLGDRLRRRHPDQH